ncbi:TonB-dependent siderophore receptor [Sphingomonas swuensis]|uniref:TonB-dependent siderophore receptor n=1 Tax=Sphingomonas swuensis TaxID=977800 RepID=A0ABP7TAR1_9SPHN
MRTVARALAGATLLVVPASSVLAAEVVAIGTATTAEEQAAQVVTVTGKRDEYGVKSTVTGTRTNTLVRDIPQAISVVSEAQIEDQSLRSVADLLLFVPGATPGTGEANRDQLTLRGNNTTADFFVDGIRDDAQYFRDFYNLDRVEVLKGPNAMIFGRGGGGGIINRVTKRAGVKDSQQFILSHDSEGGTRLTADDSLRLTGALGLRVNGVYEKGDSFRRDVDLKRYGINPTIGWQPGADTRVDLSYEYFHDRRTTDRGVPSLNGRPIKGYDRDFFGDPSNSVSDADVQIATLAVEQKFGEALLLRHRTQLADYDKYYVNVFPSSNANSGTVAIGAYNSRNDRRNLISQTDLVWDGRIAGIDQTWLVGVELGRQKSRNQRLSGRFLNDLGAVDASLGRVSLADTTVERRIDFFRSATDADNRTRATVAAGYVQTQLRPADWIELVAGLRYDRFKLRVTDERTTVPTFGRTDRLVSPRVGLVLKPRRDLSLYTSFSRSFLPQSGDQFSGLTQTSEALKPERFDNMEVGAKWELLDGLLATAALYQLDRSNTQSPNPVVGLPPLLTGATRTRGLELGLERSIASRLQVSAGYALQDSEILRTTASAPAGRKVPLVPRHSFSLWSKYQFSKPLAAGLGLLARSKSTASLGGTGAVSTATVLPGYARIDGALFYKLAPGIEAQLNVENLTNRDYFPTAHNDNNIAPGAPRTARLSLKAEF